MTLYEKWEKIVETEKEKPVQEKPVEKDKAKEGSVLPSIRQESLHMIVLPLVTLGFALYLMSKKK